MADLLLGHDAGAAAFGLFAWADALGRMAATTSGQSTPQSPARVPFSRPSYRQIAEAWGFALPLGEFGQLLADAMIERFEGLTVPVYPAFR